MTKISRERDLPFWVALAHHPDIGAATFQKLLARFPNMRSAWGASRSELEAAGWLPRLPLEKLIFCDQWGAECKESWPEFEKELAAIDK